MENRATFEKIEKIYPLQPWISGTAFFSSSIVTLEEVNAIVSLA